MNDRERQRLLDATRRQSGTIGERIPETVTVQGDAFPLREFVFECKRLDAVPESERERIEETERRLQRERLARKQRIEDGDISQEEGEALVDSIRGLDRAINALEGLDEPRYSEQLRRKKIEDAEELLSLIEQRP
ncbi:hypothetical protein I7X12_01745 [Halosimplex litoreum]|uniref:Uncharacterized protein n=1 Tax=Halosimplex litoreum TaxID=1198301 RepID=A0A7T3FZZ5_9EURY|nr:DUF5788 family protein [Halosimplex litoreum]QPV63383.1 hypothetical protein I7X12_01745 [Halosimplex litoreum]